MTVLLGALEPGGEGKVISNPDVFNVSSAEVTFLTAFREHSGRLYILGRSYVLWEQQTMRLDKVGSKGLPLRWQEFWAWTTPQSELPQWKSEGRIQLRCRMLQLTHIPREICCTLWTLGFLDWVLCGALDCPGLQKEQLMSFYVCE